ncbi:hypothetical protein LXA43DRAFT_874145, partial [Ganoderma leucocontextum]
WQCPYCPYVQRNRRSPDLKRHVKTHTHGTDVADWVCCGVSVLTAIESGVYLSLMGCRWLEEAGALICHLQREKGKCFGDALSLHQRGNR